MKTIKLCKDCKWSVSEAVGSWHLRCYHPVINAKDPAALGNATFTGSYTQRERERTWWFAKCGIKGKLYEPK
jgi:hypothetical protein